MSGEQWRAIPGYEGRYEVSNDGRIRSVQRRGATGGPKARFVRANHRIIKQADLAAMLGCSRATIQRIHAGDRYDEV